MKQNFERGGDPKTSIGIGRINTLEGQIEAIFHKYWDEFGEIDFLWEDDLQLYVFVPYDYKIQRGAIEHKAYPVYNEPIIQELGGWPLGELSELIQDHIGLGILNFQTYKPKAWRKNIRKFHYWDRGMILDLHMG